MAPLKASSKISLVDTPSIPNPKWFSHGVSLDGTGRLILTSGQIAQRSDGTFPTTFKEQVKQAVANLAAVLKAAGASPRDIPQ